ncbi:PREDICTED: probable S-adenosylmethionine-dependent methyltransferase At5g38780 [Tarenaya hassleriana]|uniref:probable S-adenosylmethionine-dependent methyltransferase At5g38780 n=1 Tax=Tarenaya hassleriana TaxID=28532 RepID=UPI00053C14D3|nr:PREDICTED: probable S-adenosylmethionine-dependent methyltransferase At5g38780 [Tarenaya hassleriana]
MAPSHTMAGGESGDSYSQHSTYQRALLEATKEKIDEAITTKLDLYFTSNSFSFNVADFGCSTGPNTFVAVQNIIDAVGHKFQEQTLENPKDVEFQVFFNDHSNNDFNTLFRTLPPTRSYFATAVPGSFFGRVLPKDCLHVGHCSYSLHWLSRVPRGITARDSPAWNKDIHCTGFTKEVADAYLDQFKVDFGGFLSARAQEFVSGGLLMLLGSCLPDGVKMSETMKGILFDCIGSSLNDVAKQGLIDQEKLDSFNMPIYVAQVGEIKDVIEENGCFELEAFEKVSHANDEFPLDAKFLATLHKVTFGGLFESQFGKDAVEKAMGCFEGKVQDSLQELANAKAGMQFFVLLRRK